MSWQFFVLILTPFLILLIVLSATLFLVWKQQIGYRHQTKELLSQIRYLTNLLASKDLTTFSQLQQLSNPTVSESPLVPMDDASVAKRMAEEMQQHGYDPNAAFDEAAVAEFGFNIP